MEQAIVEVKSEAEKGRKYGWVDALPYVDNELLEPGARSRAEQMVKEELRKGSSRRTVSPLPDMSFASAPMAQKELQRLEDGGTAESIDFASQNLDVSANASIEEYQAAVERGEAHFQLEIDKMLNLELMRKYAASTWLLSNRDLELSSARIKEEVDAVKKEIEAVNRKRKIDQEDAGATLQELKSRYQKHVEKNSKLVLECLALESRNQVKESSNPD
mmetsp:Transcript_4096/g.12311  ORF Transcript_4096/g.12311 Transcript_4096/m.12311 type:complete len:218 (-) Transcript_4096:1490-2143(-)